MVFPIRTLLFSCFAILGMVFLWIRFRQAEEQTVMAAPEGKTFSALSDMFIAMLFLAGFILFPIHFRGPLLNSTLGYTGYINFICSAAVLLSFFRFRRWTKADLWAFSVWLLLYIPMLLSNREMDRPRAITAAVQTLFPLFIVLYRMNPKTSEKTLGVFLLIFDIFVFLLLICAVEESFFGKHNLLIPFQEWMKSIGLNASEYQLYINDWRFGSIWGHPLTNALIFNSFFVLNAVYFRSFRNRYLVPLFFFPALIGVSLASSKTGVIVCFLLFLIMSWKYKKWFLWAVPVLALLFFLGVFNDVFARFSNSSLTTGRLEKLSDYFSSGINPLGFFMGYGSGSVFPSASPVHPYKAGFEFPLVMFAYDNGILFSLLHVGGLYAYATWRFLRRREWVPWLCFSLIFAEINTYNAYALRNQDVCFFFCFVTMLLLNMGRKRDPDIPEIPDIPQSLVPPAAS